ncbi:unnamed protein product [Diamesa hyperborea]
MEVSLTHGEPMVKNDNTYINLDNVRVKKVNRTHHLLIGNFTLFINQGNEYEFFALLYKKQGNEYKKTPYKVGPNKFCDFLRDEKMFYPGVLAASDFPSIETCPWPSNLYHFLGYSIQLSKAPPIFPSGDYMIEAYSELGGKMQNGYRIYGTLSNKEILD